MSEDQKRSVNVAQSLIEAGYAWVPVDLKKKVDSDLFVHVLNGLYIPPQQSWASTYETERGLYEIS